MGRSQQVKEYILKISKIIDETRSVKAFRLGLPKGANISFYPGQFFMVSFVDSEIKASRAYSIASSPANKKYIEIALNNAGGFTAKLFSMKKGGLLKFKGPYGKFYFNEETKKIKSNLVLIAGGTGITALMSIIRYCNDKRLSNKIRLFYSVKTSSDIIYKKELDGIKKLNKNFDYIAAITREDSKNWKGRKGRIDSGLLKDNIMNIKENTYYSCGPNEFVHYITAMLIDLGIKKEQINANIWG